MLYPYSLPPAAELSPQQLDGWNCIYCGGGEGSMRPVGSLRGGQLFAHTGCAEGHRLPEGGEPR